MSSRKNKNLTLMVYEHLMELMLNYEIVPGQRLVFVDLAKQLKVSRTPVNNALGILAQEGYLDFIPNQGYSVHKITRQEAEDLYEVRDVLEIGFIGQAIRRMSNDDIKRIERCKIAYEKGVAGRVTRKLFILDADYHLAIINVVGNEYLTNRYGELCKKIYLRIRTEDLVMSRIEDIIHEHNMLFEAVQTRDVDLAKECIRRHHTASKDSLFSIIFPKEG